ncbi:hypothetical protein GCM10023310_46750 [Paenibacillus vulneris]|uniref:DUF6254 family protein n=1 Tax=Paenibacillus vulneris TaxID=1133364 RepID=A0ABW3UEI9_9BACL|nr:MULTISPECIES: DUF6254 family protein [unclassified Paenibacillus]MBE1441186.1 hypothetical protein [Paenibacillus sp. OAS669]
MSRSKARRENEAKIRKQTPHPHGHITSLEEYAEEYEAAKQSSNNGNQQ